MKTLAIATAIVTLISSALVYAGQAIDPDADFDRLDGTGQSTKRVNVIEWEGNLEIHVYPAGSLKGLALKIDRPSKDKKVMVIGYRFDSAPSQQLIRRAILGIDIKEGFKVYKDLSAGDEYDKIIISNNGLALSDQLVSYKVDAEPTQLYPDGHPMLANKAGDARATARVPAAQAKKQAAQKARIEMQQQDNDDLSEGQIKPFKW